MTPWPGNISKGLTDRETHEEPARMIRVKEENNDGELHVLSYSRPDPGVPARPGDTEASVIVIDARRAAVRRYDCHHHHLH